MPIASLGFFACALLASEPGTLPASQPTEVSPLAIERLKEGLLGVKHHTRQRSNALAVVNLVTAGAFASAAAIHVSQTPLGPLGDPRRSTFDFIVAVTASGLTLAFGITYLANHNSTEDLHEELERLDVSTPEARVAALTHMKARIDARIKTERLVRFLFGGFYAALNLGSVTLSTIRMIQQTPSQANPMPALGMFNMIGGFAFSLVRAIYEFAFPTALEAMSRNFFGPEGKTKLTMTPVFAPAENGATLGVVGSF